MKGWDSANEEEANYLSCLYALHRCNKQKKDKSAKIDWNTWDSIMIGAVCTVLCTLLVLCFDLTLSILSLHVCRKSIRLLCLQQKEIHMKWFDFS
jgi:hypothetical protein